MFDFFSNSGLPATFDGRMHATMIAQFTNAFNDGELRATWSDGFGNYGMPMALINHQIIGYGGGMLNLIYNDVVLSLKLLLFIGAFLSTVFFYHFLRIYFSPESSIIGAILFNFSAYRIFNLYVRGAFPEFLASMFLPLLLIGFHSLIVSKNRYALLIIALSTAGIILTHPFTLLIYSFIFIPYFVYLIYTVKNKFKLVLLTLVAMSVGILLTGYYFVPLILEIKYFYYGQADSHLILNQFLNFQNFYNERWFYFFVDNPFVRGNYLIFGLIETVLLIFGIGIILFNKFIHQVKRIEFIYLVLLSSIFLIFLTTAFSNFVYDFIPFLANIQYPWRMLSGLIFLPPLILAFVSDQLPKNYKIIFIFLFIVILAFFRFPQLYGKNFVVYPEEYFYKTRDNVAAVVLNPIWSGLAESYPEKKEQIEIIEGKGEIISQEVTNSTRKYIVIAKDPLKVVDYTFYFPGWKLFINGVEHTIEYQDFSYKGVITYNVPVGKNTIDIVFEDTKVRKFGILISITGIMIFLSSLLLLSYKKNIHI